MTATPLVQVEGAVRRFGETAALAGVDLTVGQGEFFSLLGASGCGKTTLLRLIAGLDRPDAGRILIDGADMTAAPAHARPVNTVFQSYALFPHMSVERNVGFGLRQEGVDKDEIRNRVVETMSQFGIAGLAARRPAELSGGQRQRVALCRALVKRPKLLLLDEPLAALDRRLREQARFELKSVQARLGITFIMVTHDQEEAMSLSSRIAVMEAGRIVQVGAPRDIYDRPASRFVAEFVGDANLLEGRVQALEEGSALVDLALDAPVRMPAPPALRPGQAVTAMLRPERLRLAAEGKAGPGEAGCTGTVGAVAFLGGATLVRVAVSGGRVIEARLPETGGAPPAEGSTVTLAWPESAAAILGA
ncbi:MAG: ABC transporter ATP-binding protein [Alphaproteobacteria bacterium]